MIQKISKRKICVNNEFVERIRCISYRKDNIYGNLGTCINESKNNFFKVNEFGDDLGIYIYYNKDANAYYRIHKDCNFCSKGDHADDILIARLQRVQKKCETEFPTGIVMLDDKVIGQEIVYYNNAVNLKTAVKEKRLSRYYMYKKALLLLKNMYDNGISYLDIHQGNFAIDTDIHIFDFDDNLIKFDSDREKEICNKFCTMINKLNDDVVLTGNTFSRVLSKIEDNKKKFNK